MIEPESDDPILGGGEGDSHRGDPPDFPNAAAVETAFDLANHGFRRTGACRSERCTRRQRVLAGKVGSRRMRRAAVTGPLLERSVELARIESVLGGARDRGGGFVVVEGPAGIGKTELLAAARRSAADQGMRVLRSRGTELEREFAFGVARQLFEPPLAEASEFERANLLQAAARLPHP